jgi:CRISPR-associated protein Csb2
VRALREVLGPLFFAPATGEARRVHLWREGVWDWWMEREAREVPPIMLQRSTWTGPARVWASVTPLVFHHHPKRKEGDAERLISEAFDSALLPRPEEIVIRSVSTHAGAGHATAVPPYDIGGESMCRYQAHVTVRFAEAVEGPMLVGRGRYRGYGLFAPMEQKESQA